MYNISFPSVAFYSRIGSGSSETSCRQEIYKRFRNHLRSEKAKKEGPKQTFIYKFSRDRFRYNEYSGYLKAHFNSFAAAIKDYFSILANVIKVSDIRDDTDFKSEFIEVDVVYTDHERSIDWVKIVTTWARNFTSFLDPVIYYSSSYSTFYTSKSLPNFDVFYFMSSIGRYSTEASLKLRTIISFRNDAFVYLIYRPYINKITEIFNSYNVNLYKYYSLVMKASTGVNISTYHQENAAYSENSFFSDLVVHYIVNNQNDIELPISNFYQYYVDNDFIKDKYHDIIELFNSMKYKKNYNNSNAIVMLSKLKEYLISLR